MQKPDYYSQSDFFAINALSQTQISPANKQFETFQQNVEK